MTSPAKKRKLNSDTKPPTTPTRNLDYFFGKKKQQLPSRPNDDVVESPEAADNASALADEQLARKLQAEWNQGTSEVVDGKQEAVRENSTVSATETNSNSLSDTKHVEDDARSGIAQKEAEETVPKVVGAIPLGPVGKNTLSLQAAGPVEDSLSSDIPFDESPLTFEPSKYIQELQGHWAAEDGNASYALLTRCFVLVNSTQSRIKIVDTLVNMLRVVIEADPSSLLATVWLATNSISPPYISLELGLGGSAISKALKNVCGLDNKSLKALYDKVGDAGDVAFEAKKKQSFTLRKPKPLTIKSVYQSLVKLASTQGTGSGEVKQRIVDRLLQDARGPEESRYIVRTLCQHVSSCCVTVISYG